MWVELGTAIAFTALFWFDILHNGHQVDFVRDAQGEINQGWIPWHLWAFYLHHATLLGFLIAASLCDLDGHIIPLPLTVSGTLLGLTLAALLPWPWPSTMPLLSNDQPWYFLDLAGRIPRGIMNWPVWGPLPDWLRPGSILLGLFTGLAGAAAGNLMMRSVKFLFEKGMGREALGMGDADLMMMVGAFLGWQLVVASFFIGAFAALILAVPMLLRRRSRYLPFGPGLAIGAVAALLGWQWIGPGVQPFCFDWIMLLIAGTVMGGGMFFASLLLGLRRPA